LTHAACRITHQTLESVWLERRILQNILSQQTWLQLVWTTKISQLQQHVERELDTRCIGVRKVQPRFGRPSSFGSTLTLCESANGAVPLMAANAAFVGIGPSAWDALRLVSRPLQRRCLERRPTEIVMRRRWIRAVLQLGILTTPTGARYADHLGPLLGAWCRLQTDPASKLAFSHQPVV
jgi:hypothetical protein